MPISVNSWLDVMHDKHLLLEFLLPEVVLDDQSTGTITDSILAVDRKFSSKKGTPH